MLHPFPPGTVIAHFGEIPLPGAGSRELEDSARFDPPHEVLESTFDRARVRPFARKPHGLLEKVLTKDKTCAFHAYILHRATRGKRPKGLPDPLKLPV